MPVQHLFVYAAIPMALGAVVCGLIYRLNERRPAGRPPASETAIAPAE
jgi:hypothetical protein